ncbi:two-component sensor histidine kinase BarA [Serratia symbiotica]|uniref:two-component sensor histidine kinase BarA n=1 Tax=Serratia symbiotica TaxID=138074 RepID=UPI0013250C9E|nr:two-component sensor histidine kinase BarA [Serratia symbiotica]QTP14137.1 two-component sensor histidine kinase BarA [Serratia symbiotica]
MTKYSLRARMMILILAPTLLIGLLLSTSFVVHRYNELQEQLVNAGVNIIEPLAVASEYGMIFHSRESVRQLVSLLHRRHSEIVRSITVFDAQNNLFVTSNHHHNFARLQLPTGAPLPADLMLTRRGDSLILRTPIWSENQYPDGTADNSGNLDNNLGYVAIELGLQSVRLQQYKEVFISTLLLLLCMCISMLFAYRLMRDVTGPIRNMVNTVDRIRRGQLDSRVEGFMLGELHTLKNGINSMAMSLTAYHEEMQQNIDQATSALRETLEQMEIQNVELDLAKKRAQEAARIKSEFLANMSHELRTPLNGVIGFTRQMLKTDLSITQADYLQTIERSANNLLTIINDVLDFSKLEAGKLVLEHIPFSLRETLDDVIVLLAPSAHEKGLELTLDVHNNVPEQVFGDARRLQQIITNLLGNSVKFTETGSIDIRVELRKQLECRVELEVQIHDTGIGISERQQSQLFQAFRQADASISRSHGGTGLGLVITQKLVKEMGGDICFHSQLSRGSTFWFYIQLDLNEGMPSLQPSLTDLRGKTLAYIESNPAAAQATLNMLSVTPLVITHSLTLAQLPKNEYDFLLIGAPIPVTSSMVQHNNTLLAALKVTSRVILALSYQSQIDAEQLKQQGALGCLIKPITSNRLFPLLRMEVPLRLSPQPQRKRLPLTVMAVDDNPANLKLIGTLLAEQVEQTLLCESGEEALALARDNVLDLILMDIQMPKIDGIRTSELIHQLPHHKSTPIVAVTAHAISGEREHLLKAGMDDYLAKPIDEAMLTRVLSRYHSGEPHVAEQLLSLNWPMALRQAANKQDLARDMLEMLLGFLPQVDERVQALLDGQPDDSILDLIHKLHGSCSYNGVPRLKQLCFYLEQQLRQGVSHAQLEPEWLELLDEIALVRQAARTHLSNTPSSIT